MSSEYLPRIHSLSLEFRIAAYWKTAWKHVTETNQTLMPKFFSHFFFFKYLLVVPSYIIQDDPLYCNIKLANIENIFNLRLLYP